MRAIVIFILLTSIAMGQAKDTPARVAQLIQTITPVAPSRTGNAYEYLKYESRMRANRYDAMVELGTYGKDAAAVVPLLSKLINDQYEPPGCRLAMIETLQKIGPESKEAIPALKKIVSSNSGDGQQLVAKDFLLSIAAERAILFIECHPEEQPYRDLIDDLYPLLQQLADSEDGRTLKLLYAYYRHRAPQSPEQVVRQLSDIVTDSQKRLNLIVQLLSNRVGSDLGRTLLDSTFIDGKSTIKNLIVNRSWPHAAAICFEHLDGKEAVARQILDGADVNGNTWEHVFTMYKRAIVADQANRTQEELAEVISWLQGISATPGWKRDVALEWLLDATMAMFQKDYKQESMVEVAVWIREIPNLSVAHRHLAFEWLFKTWVTSSRSERVCLEVVETAKRLVDTVGPSDGVMLLRSWELQTEERMRFVAQLLPDIRESRIDREEAIQQLISLKGNTAFPPEIIERKLVSLIRMKPSAVLAAPPPLVEQFLIEGRFAEGEAALQKVLEANPMDDEARFGLGVLQFVWAIEELGDACNKCGERLERKFVPFLSLPPASNDSRSTVSYEELGAVLDTFVTGLSKAEDTLSMIKQDDVKLRLRLAKFTLNMAGPKSNRASLQKFLTMLNGGQTVVVFANPECRVHFDRADVAWLRAYCHLLSAGVDFYRSLNLETVFDQSSVGGRPDLGDAQEHADPLPNTKSPLDSLRVVNAPRLRSMRLHLLAVCELNAEISLHAQNEVDGDFEWLANQEQTNQLALPVRGQVFDNWLTMIEQLEGSLTGKLLIPCIWLKNLTRSPINEQRGLNLQKWLDDPPVVLFDQMQLSSAALDDKYLEELTDRNAFGNQVFVQVLQLFQSQFATNQAVDSY